MGSTVDQCESVPLESQYIVAGQIRKSWRRNHPEVTSNQPVPILPKPAVAIAVGSTFVPLLTCEMQQSSTPNLPYTTQQYQKRKLENEAMGVFKRKYKTAKLRKCGQCGKDLKSYGHTNYFSNIYCPEKCTQSLEEWKAPLRLKYIRRDRRNMIL